MREFRANRGYRVRKMRLDSFKTFSSTESCWDLFRITVEMHEIFQTKYIHQHTRLGMDSSKRLHLSFQVYTFWKLHLNYKYSWSLEDLHSIIIKQLPSYFVCYLKDKIVCIWSSFYFMIALQVHKLSNGIQIKSKFIFTFNLSALFKDMR